MGPLIEARAAAKERAGWSETSFVIVVVGRPYVNLALRTNNFPLQCTMYFSTFSRAMTPLYIDTADNALPKIAVIARGCKQAWGNLSPLPAEKPASAS